MKRKKQIRQKEKNYSLKLKTFTIKVLDKDIAYNPAIRQPKDAYSILKGIYSKHTDDDKENFVALFLNTKNKVITYKVMFSGGMTESPVFMKELFRAAILNGATSMIISHNHPSGETDPSDNDIKVTNKIKDIGKLIGIEILDHIIYTHKSYFSFESEGWMK
ncbi:JAB domain-containing protein [bacterium]|nr:JAB domain-containing protein [bacterium]